MTTAEWLRIQGAEWPGIGANDAALCEGFRRAADEIERLQRENEAMRNALEAIAAFVVHPYTKAKSTLDALWPKPDK